eukprot:6244900-Amphidinium_carterae.1
MKIAPFEAVTTRHAHVFMNYLSYSCADLDVVFELAWRGGFSGSTFFIVCLAVCACGLCSSLEHYPASSYT